MLKRFLDMVRAMLTTAPEKTPHNDIIYQGYSQWNMN